MNMPVPPCYETEILDICRAKQEYRLASIFLDPRSIPAQLEGRIRMSKKLPEDARVCYCYCDPARRHAWVVVLESEEFEEVTGPTELPMLEGGWEYLVTDEDTGEERWVERVHF